MEEVAAHERADPTLPLRKLLSTHPGATRAVGAGWRRLKRLVEGPQRSELQQWLNEVEGHLSPTEWRLLTEPYDDTHPLPPDSATALASDHPGLRALRSAYARTDLPAKVPSVWDETRVQELLDLRYFRGDSPYVWLYREWPRAMVLKYFLFTQYVTSRDPHQLLARLGEDGAFGCWTFDYRGHPRVSRDLLDSVNELQFLDRHLGILDGSPLRVLDIGAGYGRLAHRMIQAAPVADYCCVDAVPESTFLCDYYLNHRRCTPPARVVPLHELHEAVSPRSFDLALNIHSFSECTYDAVAWWLEWLASLLVPHLLIVPNDRSDLLAYEVDGTRRDYRHLVDQAGYELVVSEPVIDDPAVRDLLRIDDCFMLFRRA